MKQISLPNTENKKFFGTFEVVRSKMVVIFMPHISGPTARSYQPIVPDATRQNHTRPRVSRLASQGSHE